MNCDLAKIFGPVRATLPKDIKSKHIVFSCSTFANFPETLHTDQLIATASTHSYDHGSRTDVVNFHATKQTLQELGLLILAVVFKPGGCRVRVILDNPHSGIRNLIVEYGGATRRLFGHKTKPYQYLYHPEAVKRHPWTGCNLNLFSLPVFGLTNLRQFVVTEEDWKSRDTVMGFGNDDASVGLASLLLNIGYTEPDYREFVLEGEGGFRGVGIHSAEAVFWCYDSIEEADEAVLLARQI